MFFFYNLCSTHLEEVTVNLGIAFSLLCKTSDHHNFTLNNVNVIKLASFTSRILINDPYREKRLSHQPFSQRPFCLRGFSSLFSGNRSRIRIEFDSLLQQSKSFQPDFIYISINIHLQRSHLVKEKKWIFPNGTEIHYCFTG